MPRVVVAVAQAERLAARKMGQGIARIVAEVGQVSGGDVATYNTFSTGPNAKRLYGSIGIRAGF
jgi:L-aminopeptidase/D-esterase-like protein